MSIIYKVTNKLNEKVYIGQTSKTLEERKIAHHNKAMFGSKYHFHNAIRKYRLDIFTWEILESNIENKKELDRIEIEYIKKFNSIENGYNMSTGGGGGDTLTNHPKRKEILKKMSDAQKGHKMKKSTKEKWYKKMYIDNPNRFKKENNPMFGKSSPMKNNKHTPEAKEKQRQSHSNVPLTKTHRRNIGLSKKGIKKSEKFKKTMSRIHKGKILSSTTILKISKAKQSKIMSSKLNIYQVKRIRILLKNKKTNSSWKSLYAILAKQFKVSSRCIQKIKCNYTWQSIPIKKI